MKKIIIIGSGGVGKSALAREVGVILGLEVIHLDRHFWRPGWVETPREQWRKVVTQLVTRDGWVIDGNYSGTMDIRLPGGRHDYLYGFPALAVLVASNTAVDSSSRREPTRSSARLPRAYGLGIPQMDLELPKD